MKKVSLLVLGAAFASVSAFATNTITAGTESAPALWSDTASWDDATIVNSGSIDVTANLASGQSEGWITVSGADYTAKNLLFGSDGIYHIDIDSKLTLATGSNVLFFTNGSTRKAQVYIDSGDLVVNTGSAIYVSNSDEKVVFGKNSTYTSSQDFKVRATTAHSNYDVVVINSDSFKSGTFQILANEAATTSLAVVNGSVTTQKLVVEKYSGTASASGGAASALVVNGTMTLTGSSANTIKGYALGDSGATMRISSTGKVEATNSSNTLTFTAAAKENSALALKIDNGGSLVSKSSVYFEGNGISKDRTTAQIDGTLQSKYVYLKANTFANVAVAGSLIVDSELNIGIDTASTAPTKSALLTVTGKLQANAIAMKNSSSLVVSSTGNLNVGTGGIKVTWVNDGDANPANVTVLSSGNTVDGDIYIAKEGSITIGGDNDWNSNLLIRGESVNVDVTAGKVEFNSILFTDKGGKYAVIKVADGAILSFDNLAGEITNGDSTFKTLGTLDSNNDYLVLKDFVEETILFKNIGTTEDQAAFLANIKDGNMESMEMYFSNFDSNAGGYWLTAFAPTTVPEPAEWAAIFGALALGLAIYRRRK